LKTFVSDLATRVRILSMVVRTRMWCRSRNGTREKKNISLIIPNASASVRLVSASDKLHNARSILRDYRVHGENLWNRFTGAKEGTLRYYRSLVEAFSKAERNELIEELDRVVSEIERMSK
jgi:hypothetical protein